MAPSSCSYYVQTVGSCRQRNRLLKCQPSQDLYTSTHSAPPYHPLPLPQCLPRLLTLTSEKQVSLYTNVNQRDITANLAMVHVPLYILDAIQTHTSDGFSPQHGPQQCSCNNSILYTRGAHSSRFMSRQMLCEITLPKPISIRGGKKNLTTKTMGMHSGTITKTRAKSTNVQRIEQSFICIANLTILNHTVQLLLTQLSVTEIHDIFRIRVGLYFLQ